MFELLITFDGTKLQQVQIIVKYIDYYFILI